MSAAKPDRRALSGAARIYAVQALFQMEAADQSADRVAREFQDWRIGVDYEEGTTPEADAALFAGIGGNPVVLGSVMVLCAVGAAASFVIAKRAPTASR